MINVSDIYTSESIYASWMSLSFFALTTGMLFFHLARRKSILVNRTWAGFIAVILMGISIFYTLSALPAYRERVDLAISSCLKSPGHCDQKQLETIKRNRQINTWMGQGLIIVVLMISYLIFNTL